MKFEWSAKNIALLIGVAGVWGFAGFRAFDYLSGPEEVEEQAGVEAMVPGGVQLETSTKQTYSLIDESYRDPFLGKRSKTQRKWPRSGASNGGGNAPQVPNPNTLLRSINRADRILMLVH